jgi:hypothetical protein
LQPGIELSLFLGAAFRAVFSIKLILLGFYSEFAIKVFVRLTSADLKKTLVVFLWLIAKKMFELLEKAAIGLMAAFSGFSFTRN